MTEIGFVEHYMVFWKFNTSYAKVYALAFSNNIRICYRKLTTEYFANIPSSLLKSQKY